MSCLFDSLSHYTGQPSLETRQRIVNYIEYKALYDYDAFVVLHVLNEAGFVDVDKVTDQAKRQCLRQYIGSMRQPHIWGGALELWAFSELYHIRVDCISLRSGPSPKAPKGQWSYIPADGSYRMTIKVTWNGGHYEPVP
jgi:hypothetical protein